MAAGPDIKIQGSWGPNGFMLNVYAETLDEWKALLPEAEATLAECMGIENVIKSLRTLAPLMAAETPSSAPTAPAAAYAAPAAPQQVDGGEMCEHGAMVRRTGTHAVKGPWVGYFCPTPKDTPGQCKARFKS